MVSSHMNAISDSVMLWSLHAGLTFLKWFYILLNCISITFHAFFLFFQLGFFKRQKFDKNITDPEEIDRMLDNGKGYHA